MSVKYQGRQALGKDVVGDVGFGGGQVSRQENLEVWKSADVGNCENNFCVSC